MATPLIGIRRRIIDPLRLSLREFVGFALLVVAGFVVLFVATFVADERLFSRGPPVPLPWLVHLLGGGKAIGSLLGSVATGMITVTSITFSLLLIAVQQTASTLSTHVYDQFVRRRLNKFSFGFFVGLCIFVLFTLASAGSTHQPILGASLSLLLSGAALCMIVVLIYSTIDQMRPSSVIDAIHAHTIRAREVERTLLQRTRRIVSPGLSWSCTLRAEEFGAVGAVDVAMIERVVLAEDAGGRWGIEVEIMAGVGSNIAVRDPILRLHAALTPAAQALERIARACRAAVRIERRRTLDNAAGFGIEQLYTIAWTTGSTSKQNPQPAVLVCHCLRDLISRWSHAAPIVERPSSRIVYRADAVGDAVNALASIGVVSSESMQDVLAATVWRTLAILIEDAPAERLAVLGDVSDRLLSTLGDHAMTCEVDRGLVACEAALRGRDMIAGADRLRDAARQLASSIGHLNNRGTRASGAA